VSLEGLVTDTLNLPGVTTLKHVSSDGQHTYEARGTSPAPLGPCCLLFDPTKGRAGTQWRMFTDTTRDGQPAIIHYKLQKWKCASCGKTPQEHLAWAEGGHGFTARAAQVVFNKAIRQSFTAVGNEFGTDPKTVADIFMDHAVPAVEAIRRRTPRVLGLDEKYLWRDYRGTLANVEESTLLWLLHARTESALSGFFATMPDRDRVEVVVIDMYAPYRKMLPTWFPSATIVVDKFHIVRYATLAISTGRAALKMAGQPEEDRKELKRSRYTLLKRRENWKAHDVRTFKLIEQKWPEMAELYEWKEAAHSLFEWPHGQAAARQAYAVWLDGLPPKFRRFFRRFTNNMRDERWGKEIFNYFDHRYTNGYTERLNGMIDDANLIGRGYPYRTLFHKAMLQFGTKKPRPKRLNKAREVLDGVVLPKGLKGSIFGLAELAYLPVAIWRSWRAARVRSDDLGPDISTLAEGFRDPSVW
jgi:transposase